MGGFAEDSPLSGADFIREYFAGTQGNIFIGCFRNNDSDKRPAGQLAKLITRQLETTAHFISRHDMAELQAAIYFCTATLRNGHVSRTAADCWEFVSLFADADDKNHDLSWQQVIATLEALPFPPTLIINSGHGLQPHWLLTAPSEDAARIERLRRKLQSILASDSVPDAPRLMRLPGAHNSKFGDWLPVEVIHYTGKRYTLDELEHWLATAQTIIPPKPGNPEDREVECDSDDTYKPPIDIDARVEAMRLHGSGDTGINNTIVSVMAAQLNRGASLEEAAAFMMTAIREYAARDPAAAAEIDWQKAEDDTRGAGHAGSINTPNSHPRCRTRFSLNIIKSCSPAARRGSNGIAITESHR